MVTGANGFIGVNLCRVLNENNVKTYVLLRSEKSYRDELRGMRNMKPIYVDLDDVSKLSELMENNSIGTVFHLAWSGVSGSDRGDYDIQIRNINQTLKLIDSVKKIGCKRFIGIGSTAEYDSLNASMLDGKCPNRVGMYGASKVSTHLMSKILCNSLEMEHVWGIIGNTYGVGDRSNNFINYASQLILSDEEAKFTSGEQNYDFVYVTDVAEALYCLGEKGKDKFSYYIGSGNPRKLKDYIISIRDVLNPSKEIKLGAVPFNGVSADINSFNIERLKNDTGYKPRVCFEEGIKLLFEQDNTIMCCPQNR